MDTSYSSKVQDCIIEDYILSYTARYWGFYGTHLHRGVKCFIVGVVNTEDGSVTKRHYNERKTVNETLTKDESSKAWEEFKAGLARVPTEEEKEADRQLLEAWEEAARIATRRAKGGKHPWLQ